MTEGLPPPIDPAALANLRAIGGGDPAFIGELIQMFREDSPPRLDEIESALAAGRAAEVARAAHSLKGAAANFGAARFRELAQAIETAGRAGDLAAVPTLLTALRAEYARVLAALEAAP